MSGEIVDTTPALWPVKKTFEGRAITLIPVDPDEHLDDLYKNISGQENNDLWIYTKVGPFADKPSFREYLATISTRTDGLIFSMMDSKTKEAVGILGLINCNQSFRVTELGGIIFAKKLQRTIAGTEAMYLLIKHAFDDLGYRRLEWNCHALNQASRRAALRLGFTFEGIFRQELITKGRNEDTAHFSIIDKEWPDRKKAFETWLSPNNFDEDGVQKQSLGVLTGANYS